MISLKGLEQNREKLEVMGSQRGRRRQETEYSEARDDQGNKQEAWRESQFWVTDASLTASQPHSLTAMPESSMTTDAKAEI